MNKEAACMVTAPPPPLYPKHTVCVVGIGGLLAIALHTLHINHRSA